MKNKKKNQLILMGNEAIALGIVENGCTVAASYPGTPASEILSSLVRFRETYNRKMHIEWSVNEKCAFEVALANSYMGGRSAASMKQVGLNVALDPFMSAAYTGVIGGFIIVSADDPGPHSSQTEQDSRLLALAAKIPVFDPQDPQEAHDIIKSCFDLSEQYEIPVMLRPTTRICHARQNVLSGTAKTIKHKSVFQKDPARWAATPKYRFKLHTLLNEKLSAIAQEKTYTPRFYKKNKQDQKYCILASGAAYAYVLDTLNRFDLHHMFALVKIIMPFPLSDIFITEISRMFEKVIVFEETYPVIEMQIPDRRNICGKLSGFVPKEGELTPDIIASRLHSFLKKPAKTKQAQKQGGLRPSLCPGCPHRASFFAIKKALPKALYPGDIGCYTLGINFGAVDTCLCMGASINIAAGFYHSFTATGSELKSIVAAIGDSTFIHSGIPALVNAVYNKARFILVILDNGTTAMTGNQPTAATGILPDGSQGNQISLENIIKGSGISFIKSIDPYDVKGCIELLREADAYSRSSDGGIAVIIARHPCLMHEKTLKRSPVSVNDNCTGCQYCMTHFECPAFVFEKERLGINRALCTGCGVCTFVCPVGAIVHESLSNEK